MKQQISPLVVIPAFNESPHVGTIVREIIEIAQLPVLVIDDASTDDTGAISESAGATVLSLSSQLGAWGATQTGIRYAQKIGYPKVITFDADGQHKTHEIKALLEALDSSDADVVIGSYTQRGSNGRKTAWTWLRMLSGLTINDLTSGFRAYSKDVIELLARPEGTILDYQDIGVLCLLSHAGFKIKEIQTSMQPRKDGKSRIFNSWFAVGKYIIYSSLLAISHSKYIIKR